MNTQSPYLPILLLAGALAVWSGAQTYTLLKERDAYLLATGNQETPLANANKLRQTLDSLANETRQLADGGNQNAKFIVDSLERQGIHLTGKVNASTAPSAESGK